MSIRLGTSMIRRTRPRFLRTRKLDWTTDGIDFLRLTRAVRGGRTARTEQRTRSYARMASERPQGMRTQNILAVGAERTAWRPIELRRWPRTRTRGPLQS